MTRERKGSHAPCSRPVSKWRSISLWAATESISSKISLGSRSRYVPAPLSRLQRETLLCWWHGDARQLSTSPPPSTCALSPSHSEPYTGSCTVFCCLSAMRMSSSKFSEVKHSASLASALSSSPDG